MAASYWKQVQEHGLAVPEDRPLDDLTAELTRMLGSPDPDDRDGIAYPLLSTWVARGVYDDLLVGLGDGMAAGLRVGIGERDTDTVFRRSFSALVLAECIARDNQCALVPGDKILEWGDRLATWLLAERDLRGFVPGKGWAHAIAHGADAISMLAESPYVAGPELTTVLLDVIADRLLLPVDELLVAGETDRLALATMNILRRDLVPLTVLEPWIARLTAHAGAATYDDRTPNLAGQNTETFLRALYLQLSLAGRPPAVRADLLLVLVDALRTVNPHYLRLE